MSLDRGTGLWSCVWPVAIGLLTVFGFQAVGERFFNGYLLDLGSVHWPTPGYTRFIALWTLFGATAAVFFAVGIVRLISREASAAGLIAWWNVSSERLWIMFGSLGGLLIPLALRAFLLRGAPLTDDESAYRFMGELLASGRLRVGSPPLKLFFDQIFMINDGHLYAQYFVGWPALMAPGVWLGFTGAMNSIYSALTVPALFLVLRRLAGGRWAKVGVVLYLFAPLLMVGAATELSHTSCLMALAWETWFVLRARDENGPWWADVGVALFFGLAFFIRPSAALGIGLPMLVWWLLGMRHVRGKRLVARGLAFLIPALCLAATFLVVNKVQNGSFTTVSYQRYHTYMEENGFRFSFYRTEDVAPANERVPLISGPKDALVSVGVALFRLNFDLFGWPSSLLFTLFAGVRRLSGLFWCSVLCFFVLHVPLLDSGIDSFGPVHYFEVAWPFLLLTVLGLRALCEEAGNGAAALPPGIRFPRPECFPPALMVAFLLVTLAGYVPVRFGALARIADNINMPREAVKQADLHAAIVFAPQPFAPPCRSTPTEHFVFWRPNSDPDLTNDVLWVNHIGVEQDRRLMQYFPGRRGYVMVWLRPCRVALLPLDELQPGSIPNGFIGGTGEGPA